MLSPEFVFRQVTSLMEPVPGLTPSHSCYHQTLPGYHLQVTILTPGAAAMAELATAYLDCDPLSVSLAAVSRR